MKPNPFFKFMLAPIAVFVIAISGIVGLSLASRVEAGPLDFDFIIDGPIDISPNPAVYGSPITFTVTVKNLGPSTAAPMGNLPVSFYLDMGNNGFEQLSPSARDDLSASLAPGTTGISQWTTSVANNNNWTVFGGVHRIRVCVNAYGNPNSVNYAFPEADTSYNCVTETFGTLPPPGVLGCTNSNATNFNPLATEDDGSCIVPYQILISSERSCINPGDAISGFTLTYGAHNWLDGSRCTLPDGTTRVVTAAGGPMSGHFGGILGATTIYTIPTQTTDYTIQCTTPDGARTESAVATVLVPCPGTPDPQGCMDPDATNYDPSATVMSTCTYLCNDPGNANYHTALPCAGSTGSTTPLQCNPPTLSVDTGQCVKKGGLAIATWSGSYIKTGGSACEVRVNNGSPSSYSLSDGNSGVSFSMAGAQSAKVSVACLGKSPYDSVSAFEERTIFQCPDEELFDCGTSPRLNVPNGIDDDGNGEIDEDCPKLIPIYKEI